MKLACVLVLLEVVALMARGAAPATQSAPATAPASAPATTSLSSPLTVESIRDRADVVTIGRDGEQFVIDIASRKGIGAVTVSCAAESWPTPILVRLHYIDGRSFQTLEGFTCALYGDDGVKPVAQLTHEVLRSSDGISVMLHLPQQVRGELRMTWIDAYR